MYSWVTLVCKFLHLWKVVCCLVRYIPPPANTSPPSCSIGLSSPPALNLVGSSVNRIRQLLALFVWKSRLVLFWTLKIAVMAFCFGSLLVPSLQHSRDAQSQILDSLNTTHRSLPHLVKLLSTGLMGKHSICWSSVIISIEIPGNKVLVKLYKCLQILLQLSKLDCCFARTSVVGICHGSGSTLESRPCNCL